MMDSHTLCVAPQVGVMDSHKPLHVTVPGSSPQQYEFEAHNFRDLTSESYVTDCATIVVYY